LVIAVSLSHDFDNIQQRRPFPCLPKQHHRHLGYILDIAHFQDSNPKSSIPQELIAVAGPDERSRDLIRNLYLLSNDFVDKLDTWTLSEICRQLKTTSFIHYLVPERIPVAQTIARALMPAAIRSCDISLLKSLLLTGININGRFGYARRVALELAVAEGSAEATKFLLDHGANANACFGALSLFKRAVLNDQLELVQLLIDNGADVNATEYYRHPWRTALSFAATTGRVWLARLLLANGAHVYAGCGHRDALQSAVKGGNLDTTTLILDAGADDIHSALKRAASYGHEHIIEFLIRRYQLDFTNSPGFLAHIQLLAAVNCGNSEHARHLLVSGAQDDQNGSIWKAALRTAKASHSLEVVQWLIHQGRKPASSDLRVAIREADIKLARLLLKHGGDINFDKINSMRSFQIFALSNIETTELFLGFIDFEAHGTAVLVSAIERGSLDVLRLIVAHAEHSRGLEIIEQYETEAKALVADEEDPDYLSPFARPMIYLASLRSFKADLDAKFEMAAFLIEKGATDMTGTLQAAAESGNLRLMDYLISKGADINAFTLPEPEYNYYTAIEAATHTRNYGLIHLLLARGAVVTGKALQAAVDIQSVELVRQFLDLGADINTLGTLDYETFRGDPCARTVLQTAAYRCNLELIRILLDAGAHVESENVSGAEKGTALQYAALKGAMDIVQVLVKAGADVNADEKVSIVAKDFHHRYCRLIYCIRLVEHGLQQATL